MKPRAAHTSSGFSLVECIAVVVLTGVVLAVAARPMASAYRNGQLQGAVDQARSIIERRAVDAGRGDRRRLDVSEIPLPPTILANPRGLAPPPGTAASDRVEFQGRRGTALVAGRPVRAAWVFAHEAQPDYALAVVVGSSALAEDWVYEDGEWRRR